MTSGQHKHHTRELCINTAICLSCFLMNSIITMAAPNCVGMSWVLHIHMQKQIWWFCKRPNPILGLCTGASIIKKILESIAIAMLRLRSWITRWSFAEVNHHGRWLYECRDANVYALLFLPSIAMPEKAPIGLARVRLWAFTDSGLSLAARHVPCLVLQMG